MVEAKNQADALVFTAEKTLKDAGDKAKEEDKKKVEEEIKNVKEVLSKDEPTKEEIEKASNGLSEVLQQVGAAMYQSQQQQTPGGETPTEEKSGEDKKEEKKEDKDKAEEGEVVE